MYNSEKIFRQAFLDITMGVVINGRATNNIRYVDHTVIIVSSIQDVGKN